MDFERSRYIFACGKKEFNNLTVESLRTVLEFFESVLYLKDLGKKKVKKCFIKNNTGLIFFFVFFVFLQVPKLFLIYSKKGIQYFLFGSFNNRTLLGQWNIIYFNYRKNSSYFGEEKINASKL